MTRLFSALVLVALVAFTAGCDDDDDNGNGEPPTPDLNAAFSVSINELTVDFTDESTGEIESYSWDFDDGASSTEASPTHTYASGGTYDVSLTIEDADGNTDTETRAIEVEEGFTPEPEPDVVPSLLDTTVVTDANIGDFPAQAVGDTLVFVNEQDCETGAECGVIDLAGGSEITWTSNYTWILQGRVFVNDGQTLTIEPGTVIRGEARFDPNRASALIVAQGGTINADGEADDGTIDPIIFTAEDDNLDALDDLSPNADGTWGGVIILGRAPINSASELSNVEGIPTSVTRGAYGGNDAGDNSGTFRYVSIRYAGILIGSGNEINGLTMGGVGNGTTIEYVEVYNNQDDGFEWFGGTVNARYLVSARVGDDSFDIDQGFDGSLQFLLAIQDTERGDRTAEHDGGIDPETATPEATPQIYNATYIGSGSGGEGDIALKLRDNFGGSYYNSVFFDFPAPAVELENLSSGGDTFQQFEDEELRIEGNAFFGFPASGDELSFRDLVENDNTPEGEDDATTEDGGGQTIAAYLEANNAISDPGFSRGTVTIAAGTTVEDDIVSVSVFPGAGSSLPEASYPDTVPSFIEQVDYIGAFEAGGTNWADWTFSAQIDVIQ